MAAARTTMALELGLAAEEGRVSVDFHRPAAWRSTVFALLAAAYANPVMLPTRSSLRLCCATGFRTCRVRS